MFMALIKVHYKPFKEKMQYWVAIGHEIGMLLINYLLFCFTDFVDADAAIVIGNCTILILLTEIIIFFGLGVIPVIYKIKLHYRRHQYRKEMKLKVKP
jgi:hypothetical protein